LEGGENIMKLSKIVLSLFIVVSLATFSLANQANKCPATAAEKSAAKSEMKAIKAHTAGKSATKKEAVKEMPAQAECPHMAQEAKKEVKAVKAEAKATVKAVKTEAKAEVKAVKAEAKKEVKK